MGFPPLETVFYRDHSMGPIRLGEIMFNMTSYRDHSMTYLGGIKLDANVW